MFLAPVWSPTKPTEQQFQVVEILLGREGVVLQQGDGVYQHPPSHGGSAPGLDALAHLAERLQSGSNQVSSESMYFISSKRRCWPFGKTS